MSNENARTQLILDFGHVTIAAACFMESFKYTASVLAERLSALEIILNRLDTLKSD